MTDLRLCCQQARGEKTAVWGLCSACYQRWNRAGRPADGPPPPMAREESAQLGSAAWRAIVEGRREDYADLRAWGISVEEAAARLGVHVRTAWRYERARHAQAVS